ncbi:MAG: hypothetical protein U0792_19270 [Gemmataceae bacterium]
MAEARQPIGIECPKCEAELTVEFRKPTALAGVSPRVVMGYPLSAIAFAALARKRQSSPARSRMKQRGGGSMAGVMVAGLGTLLLSVSGLGATGYYLFNNLESPNHLAAKQPNPTPVAPSPPRHTPATESPPPTTAATSTRFDLKPILGMMPSIDVPTLPAEPTTIDLLEKSGKAGAVAVGGGGRYLVIHFPEQGLLDVFDFSEGKFLGAISTDKGDVKLAAGLSRVVLSPGGGVFRVYSLPNLTRQYDGSVDLAGGVAEMAMGNRTDGPMLVSNPAGDVALLELTGSGFQEVKEARRRFDFVPTNLRALPDGTAFISSMLQYSATSYTHNVKLITESHRDWQITSLGSPVCTPGPDGNFYGNLAGAMDRRGQTLGFTLGFGGSPGRMWFVPAVTRQSDAPFTQQGYILRINSGLMSIPVTPPPQPAPQPAPPAGPQPVLQADQKIAVQPPPRITYITKPSLFVTLHMNGSLAMLPNVPMLRMLPEFDGLVDANGIAKPTLDQHFFLVPEAKLLVILSGDRTKLVLRKLNI